jgi:hypothetical protein
VARLSKARLKRIVQKGASPPNPSESYLNSLGMLDSVTRDCINVSQGFAGISSPTGKNFYASVLFTAMITKSITLLNIAPLSDWSKKYIEHWDYGSMSNITRSLMETRCAFHYLCTENCTETEWNCRWNLLNLHDCISRKRLFEAQEDARDQVIGFDKQAEELRERLRNNIYFLGLKEQKKAP